jgi:hypothetical protein
MDEACGTHEEKTNAYMVLSVKPEGKGGVWKVPALREN